MRALRQPGMVGRVGRVGLALLGAGTTPGGAEFFDTLLIHDTFTALGNGTNLDGWTPDTVNTPGNSWVEAAAGRNQGDGTGLVQRIIDFATARIDTGVTNNILRAEMSVTLPSTKEGQFLVLFASATYSSFVGGTAGLHGLELRHHTDDVLHLNEVIDGVRTTLANTSVPRTIGVTYDYALEFDGTDLKAYVDQAEVAALTQASYSVPAALDGNSIVATDGSTPADWDDFKVYTSSQAPAGGDALLLESGDTLLLESGDRLLLE